MEKTNKSFKKGIKIALLSIFYLIIGFLLLFSIATLSVKTVKDIPNLFGKGFLAVHEQADSMVGDNKDSFNPGDLVFVKVLSEKQKEALDLQKLKDEGAVISFYDHNIRRINTHRVVGYNETTKSLTTQGDNESSPDIIPVYRNDIIALYTGKAKGLGKPIAFMQTPLGFGLIVVMPTLALLIYQGIVLIRNIYISKEEKLKLSLEENIDLERERIRAELLEEMKKEAESED